MSLLKWTLTNDWRMFVFRRQTSWDLSNTTQLSNYDIRLNQSMNNETELRHRLLVSLENVWIFCRTLYRNFVHNYNLLLLFRRNRPPSHSPLGCIPHNSHWRHCRRQCEIFQLSVIFLCLMQTILGIICWIILSIPNNSHWHHCRRQCKIFQLSVIFSMLNAKETLV